MNKVLRRAVAVLALVAASLGMAGVQSAGAGGSCIDPQGRPIPCP